MTRQRVDPDKRQRTAHACDSCKRRKQKCDGRQSCAACTRRHFDCVYTRGDGQQELPTPNDPRSTDTGVDSPITLSQGRCNSSASLHSLLSGCGSSMHDPMDILSQSCHGTFSTPLESKAGRAEMRTDNPMVGQMMGDPQGRMQYFGTSANPSFLELVRVLVKTLTGVSQFTQDGEHQQQMTERGFVVSSNVNVRNLIPPKATAMVLIDSFFQNTAGTLEVFDEQAFVNQVHLGYRNTALLESAFLCHFYLVLAIGLSLSTPLAGSQEAMIVDALHTEHPHRCEEYYFAAKKMCNPQNGFEDADFWSIQALALMSWLMLCRSQRSKAYAYAGMAIRSAHALGLQHPEALMHFDPSEQDDRKKTWRTLFILDLFLADSLGRPTAMADSDLSSPILDPSTLSQPLGNGTPSSHVCAAAFEASMMTSHMISQILQKVYTSPKVETAIIQEIAAKCQVWPKKRAPFLSWRNASPRDVRLSTAILHCNLGYCQSMMLLSRPLFFQLLMQEIRQRSANVEYASSANDKFVSTYATICVEACVQTVSIVNTAYTGGYLPRMNPIASYHVFSAALVIFVNELVRPGANEQARQWMEASILILEYCGELDPQARQSALTLKELNNVIDEYRQRQASLRSDDDQYHSSIVGGQYSKPSRSQLAAEPSPTPLPYAFLPSATSFNFGSSPTPTHSSDFSYDTYSNHYVDEALGHFPYSQMAEPFPKNSVQVDSISNGGPTTMALHREADGSYDWSTGNQFENNIENATSYA